LLNFFDRKSNINCMGSSRLRTLQWLPYVMSEAWDTKELKVTARRAIEPLLSQGLIPAS
jgi:hypothetical protein